MLLGDAEEPDGRQYVTLSTRRRARTTQATKRDTKVYVIAVEVAARVVL